MTDPMPPPRYGRISAFARDVAVNVLGNLCTAGVVYLAAVAGGYLAASPTLTTIAVALVMAFVGALVGPRIVQRNSNLRLLAFGASMAVLTALAGYVVLLVLGH